MGKGVHFFPPQFLILAPQFECLKAIWMVGGSGICWLYRWSVQLEQLPAQRSAASFQEKENKCRMPFA